MITCRFSWLLSKRHIGKYGRNGLVQCVPFRLLSTQPEQITSDDESTGSSDLETETEAEELEDMAEDVG